jgi:ADP-ribose pyrophosphatase YjhB (NUDIX family)
MAYRNPTPTVDIIIRLPGDRVVLIERANEPLGWAFPGGFVDYGECLEDAARREAKEETHLDVELKVLLGVYSDPNRDPRQHTMSATYVARASQEPVAGDDAAAVAAVPIAELLDREFAFDHGEMARDFVHWVSTGELPKPR